MRKKQLHNWKKEELIEELKRRNFQYGELSNKYAELKYKFERGLGIKEKSFDEKRIELEYELNKEVGSIHKVL